jgi:hypothetical protein
MTLFFAYITRLLVILLGFSLAVLVALMVVSLSMWMQPNPIETILAATALATKMAYVGAYLGGTAGLLYLLLICISEVCSLRDWLIYSLGGAVITGGTMVFFTGAHDVSDRGILTVAGMVGGGVYWLIAGRNAGKMYERIIAERLQ